jgi:hypothetical protein
VSPHGAVAEQHENRAVRFAGLLGQRLQGQPRRLPGAVLRVLHHDHGLRRDLGEVRDHLVAAVPDDDGQVGRVQLLRGGDDVAQHGAAADLVQDLGLGRLHPLALAGRQDDDGRRGVLLGHGDWCSSPSMIRRLWVIRTSLEG